MYYRGYKTLTHQALFNLVVGQRSEGKTFWFKEWAIKDFLKTGAQFIYIRRYETDFEGNDQFFTDIQFMFPKHSFEVIGDNYFIDGILAGYGVALSKSGRLRGVPFPNVNKMCYDEFLLQKGMQRYIPGEVTLLLDLYVTVSRDRDVIMFMLANAITENNPYFLYWDLQIPYQKTYYRKGEILLEITDNEARREETKKTRFYQGVIAGTPFADYAVDNKFLLDSSTFIEKKNSNARYMFSMVFKDNTIGVWVSYKDGKYWLSEDVDPSNKLSYSITLQDHSPNTMILKNRKRSTLLSRFFDAFEIGRVCFESQRLKGLGYDIIKMKGGIS